MIFFIAALERRMHRIDEVTYSVLIAIVVLAGRLDLPEPDFGTSMAIPAIAAVMIFAAGLNWRYLAGVTCSRSRDLSRGDGLGLPPPPNARVLNPRRSARHGFQIIQSPIAIGTGGVGQGLMNGQKCSTPGAHTEHSRRSRELGRSLSPRVTAPCVTARPARGCAPDTSAVRARVATMVAGAREHGVVLGLLPTKGSRCCLRAGGRRC